MPDAGAGTRYRFRIDGEIEVPDPASRFSRRTCMGRARSIDHALPMAAHAIGAAGHGTRRVFLELHVGTFTPRGTFRAAIDKLDHLVEHRHHRDRADAGRRFSGPLELGL